MYTSFGFCISRTTGMESIGQEKIMTDYGKYEMYLKFETGHFQNFSALQKIWHFLK